MYEFKFGGKRGSSYQLVDAADLLVVRTEAPVSPDQFVASCANNRSASARMLPVAAFPEADVTIYKCLPEPGTNTLRFRNQMKRDLQATKGVRFAGRVLKDHRTGEPVVYTENFFIKFQDDLPQSRCQAIIKEYGLAEKEQLAFANNAWFAEAPCGTGRKVFDMAHQLLELSEVELCHPELVRPKKPKFNYAEQWHLVPVWVGGALVNQHINILPAWEKTKGDGITIAIIDDGVDQRHPEFAGRIKAPFDAVTNQEDGNPKRPGETHGTSCAGVACAGGVRVAGVAPDAYLMPIRSGGLGSVAEAKAFAWAVNHEADVISCSWGPMDGYWWDSNDPQHWEEFPLPDSTRLAMDFALDDGRRGKGCVITWAAGNGNESADLDGYASHPGVIAVAACNDHGTRSYYSDYGEAVWCCFPSSDVDARHLPIPRPQPRTPGILTTDLVGRAGENPGVESQGGWDGNYTNSFGGTSAACPGVAGVAALMLAINPDLTWQKVKDLMRYSCDRIDEQRGGYDAQGHSIYYGFGRINAEKALRNTLATLAVETTDAIAPTVRGAVEFYHAEKVPFDGHRIGEEQGERDRIMGFICQLDDYAPHLQLEYRAKVNNLGWTDWTPAGQFCGTADGRRKLIAVAFRLKGTQSADFNICYEILPDKSTDWQLAKNGAIAGTDNKRGPAVEGLSVWLEWRG